ncbi:MAG TPA: sulfite exporter TauE/SafE family protein, partial [Alphaproteobacteria bacterium]|nr:sulfite exporter TauE/SafE family protein [Alphaproteobacteria bacterium]
MSATDISLLFLVALIAGALNSLAGGGSFLSFPTLVFTGL